MITDGMLVGVMILCSIAGSITNSDATIMAIEQAKAIRELIVCLWWREAHAI